MKYFNIIVAMDKVRGIGRKGRLPWHLPGELRHFKEVTSQSLSPRKRNVIIMGRKTWESIPEQFRPLSERVNIVLTRNQRYVISKGAYKASTLEEAMHLLDTELFRNRIDRIFIIGGQQIFQQTFRDPCCQKLYVTHIQQDFSCDTFFPSFENYFERQNFSSCHNEKGCTYYFAEYHPKKS